MSAADRVRTAVVVGNPRPGSRTLAAATHVAHELAGAEPDLVVDLAAYAGRLLDWADTGVADLVAQVAAADLVVVASPTFKATYSGLLKVFLDRFSRHDGTGLSGVAVPLMLGAGPGHALAPEVSLRPLLTEIGNPGSSTVRGLYVVDALHDDPSAYAAWLADVRPAVRALVHLHEGVPA